ncbi:MAG: bifunctional nicotinamidase/pyrazinamidase [Candidatus Lokiarchaeota archaeon]|nr:bifunctional nicotinamidase/pyrazinamidase [Candidatus Lokiarchaeota archaeon]MBD3199417.1 bifunctional nicotinamidase/pyrazinamidase [Candidatus Lokiarchaeota archaeon]
MLKIEDLSIQKNIELGSKDGFIIVDMQYDFIPGGALPVEGGDQIIPGINQLAKAFKESGALIVQTQDWHPKDHLSFASNHPGKKPGDEYSELDGLGPILWPDHCVQGTKGAEFHQNLQTIYTHSIIRKGIDPKVDSYSGFRDKNKKKETGLRGYLQSLNIERLFICGLALDYCVYFTAIDGVEFGFKVYVIPELTKGIDDPQDNISKALDDMNSKGILYADLNSF